MKTKLGMKRPHTIALTALLCLWFAQSVYGQAAGPPAEFVPHKHPLVLPLPIAGRDIKPGASLECTVSFGPAIPISALAFSPDGKTLAAGGYQEVVIWDLAGAKLLKRVGAGQIGDVVRAVAFRKDGQSLIVSEGAPRQSGAVRVFALQTGQPIVSFQEPKDVVYSLALSPDEKLLAAGSADGSIYVWSLDEKKPITVLKEHTGLVYGVSFSPDGKFLASASADNTAQLWEVAAWKPTTKMRQADTVYGSAFSPDGQFVVLAVGGPGDRAIRVRKADNAQEVRAMGLGATTPLDVIWVPKGNRFYVPCSDQTVKIYNAANGAQIANLTGHGDWVYSVAVTADETKLASGGADGTVRLWNAADGKHLATFLQLAPRTDDWLILTAQGYFGTSAPGALQWKPTNLETPPDKITAALLNPELVRKAIAGDKIDPPPLR